MVSRLMLRIRQQIRTPELNSFMLSSGIDLSMRSLDTPTLSAVRMSSVSIQLQELGPEADGRGVDAERNC